MQTNWEKILCITLPSTIIGIVTIVLFITQQFLFPTYTQTDFLTFLYVALSNLVIIVMFGRLIERHDRNLSDYSGYLLFYSLVLFGFYLLFQQSTWEMWNLYVLSLLLLYRLAYLFRYGGFPIVTFLINVVAMYVLLNRQPITWLIGIYFVMQIIELLFEKKIQFAIQRMIEKLAPWILLGYIILIAIIMLYKSLV